jgi:unsaturated chondroitin disaccharide hydrolase
MARQARGRLVAVVLVAAIAAVARPARAYDQATAACVLDLAAQKVLRADARLQVGASPKSTGADGRWRTVAAADAIGWTQGFFPGSLWLLFEGTAEAKWRARAEAWTAPLAVQRTNTESHDLGFKLVPSFGAMERLTGSTAAREVLLAAAASLATRFDARLGAVKCCDWNPDWAFPVVVDTMVNLELLLWGAAHGGDPAWRDMALAHAATTARDLVRADGGTFHVVDYDPATGAIRSRGTYQGAGAATTWSRGQAWAMLGFATLYRETGDAAMLATARKVADYWVARVPSDGVPNWDFDAARVEPDSSAAAAAALALLDLATHVTGADATPYRALALRTLETLSSDRYLDRSAGEALLRHGVGDLPHGVEIDVGLAYGDYYFAAAVLRAFPRPGPCASATAPEPPAPVGSGSPTSPPTTPGTPATPAEPAPLPAPTPAPAPASRGGGCASGDAGAGSLLGVAAAAAVGLLARRRRRPA